MAAVADITGPATTTERARRRPTGRVLGSTGGRVGTGILAVLVVCAAAAPLLAPYAPDAIDPGRVMRGLNLHHLLGSDDSGRDVFSRLLYAYRISLAVAAGAVGLALPTGGAIGLLAGYYGGLVDAVLMRPVEMLLAFPALLLGLTLISVLGPGTTVTILAIAIIYVPIFARVMRSSTQVVRQELYVSAARTRGASHRQIILRHVLPNAIGPVLVQATVLAGVAILVEAALSYLGLGVQPPTASLGSMLAEGQQFLTQAPWIEIAPGIALAVTVLAFNLVGDALRERLDPGGLAR
jgi:peptide/nickel transport system permease protein